MALTVTTKVGLSVLLGCGLAFVSPASPATAAVAEARQPTLHIVSTLGESQIEVPSFLRGTWRVSPKRALLTISGSNPIGYTTTLEAVLDTSTLAAATTDGWICVSHSYVVRTTAAEYVGTYDDRVQWARARSGWRTVMGGHGIYSATNLQTTAMGIHYTGDTALPAPVPSERDGRYVLNVVIPDEVQEMEDTISIRPGACRGAFRKG